MAPPYVYLDEPVDAQIVEMIDYVEEKNRIKNDYIIQWAQRHNDPAFRGKLNLNVLLYEVFQLYTKAPPLSFDEM